MAKDSKTNITSKVQDWRGSVKSQRASSSASQCGIITQKQLDASLARVKSMTHEELVESLKKSGVLTHSNKLAKHYRS